VTARRTSPFFPEPLSEAERDQLHKLVIRSIIAIVLLGAAFFFLAVCLMANDWSNIG
jgi:hypothetical protein